MAINFLKNNQFQHYKKDNLNSRFIHLIHWTHHWAHQQGSNKLDCFGRCNYNFLFYSCFPYVRIISSDSLPPKGISTWWGQNMGVIDFRWCGRWCYRDVGSRGGGIGIFDGCSRCRRLPELLILISWCHCLNKLNNAHLRKLTFDNKICQLL